MVKHARCIFKEVYHSHDFQVQARVPLYFRTVLHLHPVAACNLCTFRLLLGPTGFSSAGVPIELRSGVATIFARVANLLTDGDGFRVSYDWKGHASMKPCFKHWNAANSYIHTHRQHVRLRGNIVLATTHAVKLAT